MLWNQPYTNLVIGSGGQAYRFRRPSGRRGVYPSRSPADPAQATYTLDLAVGGQRFSNQTPSWPGYSFTVTTTIYYHAHLPLVHGDATATTASA